MNKVTFSQKQIMVNGQKVGQLEGSRSQVYVVLGTVAVARFKYGQPTATAKHFIKWLLERNAPEAIVAAIGFDKSPLDGRLISPMEYAEAQGYKSLAATQAVYR
jgi:hypothetical protein